MKYQGKDIKHFDSLIQFIEFFDKDDICTEYLLQLRWGETPCCPFCAAINVTRLKGGKRFQCNEKACRKQFGAKSKTIFNNSKLPLKRWYLAIFLEINNKKGISSLQLSRYLNITQKTAWNTLIKISSALRPILYQEFGAFEIDETYLGGREKWKHKDKKYKKDKLPIFGIVNKETKEVIAFPVNNTSKAEIIPIIQDLIADGSEIHSDGNGIYWCLADDYTHKKVFHCHRQYVYKDSTINNIEGFWSHLKTTIRATHHSISNGYAHNYIDAISFRYNTRNMCNELRFIEALERIIEYGED